MQIRGKISQWAVFSTFLTRQTMSSNVEPLTVSVISFIFVNPSVVSGGRRRKKYFQEEIFFYLIEVQDPAGRPDRVEDSVVDDSVHGEGDAVRGEDLLGRNLIHSSSGVDTTNLQMNYY